MRFQETIDSVKEEYFHTEKEKEENCPYRIKQTKNRKTILINCKECNSPSSLNDRRCRKNILEILRKEVNIDCLVLSRLYERDYEGEFLSLLYNLASFKEIIAAYISTEKVPENCSLLEKDECNLERQELLSSFVKLVETDPLEARLEIKRCIDENVLKKAHDIQPSCTVCSECFYQMLHEIEKKISSFPETQIYFPMLKRINPQQPLLKSTNFPDFEIECFKTGYKEINDPERLAKNSRIKISEESEEGIKKPIKELENEIGKLVDKITRNLRKDTSEEIILTSPSENSRCPISGKKKEMEKEGKKARENKKRKREWKPENEKGKYSETLSEEIFDYESAIKCHVRPPFSSSRVYTEAPLNTEFLECYEISNKEGRSLEVSIYRYTDRPEKLYMICPPEYNLLQEELRLIEKVRSKMIRHRPKDLDFVDPVGAREYFKRMANELLEDELLAGGENCTPEELEKYADLLARYTNGLGIVEDLLSDSRITDVYINAPADTNPVHVVIDGEECVSNIFLSQDDLDALVSRFRTISGRPFGEAVPVLELNLEAFGVRVSVIGDPLSTNGLAYAFRKHSLSPWTLPKLINTGSISSFGAGLLSFLMDGQASVLVAGEVGAGKTSLLSAMLLEIPQKYRILTIEDTHELPVEQLQDLGWKVQGMSSYSSVLKSGAEMSPETALRAALRLGNSALVLGEVRGPEVKVLYEAMQVGKAGNSVIGTIHGSSIENVYERIVHTLEVPPASFKATDAVIICSAIRLEGTMKKLKRVSRIAEVTNTQVENPEPSEIFTDIMDYDAAQDSLLPGKALEQGQSELIEKISRKWGISIDRALKNIEVRTKIKEKIALEGLHKPILLEAEAVTQANNMFWLLMDSMGQEKIGRDDQQKDSDFGLENELEIRDDMESLYKKWEIWFEAFARYFKEKN